MFRVIVENVARENHPRATRLIAFVYDLAQNVNAEQLTLMGDYRPDAYYPSLATLARLQDDVQKAQPGEPVRVSVQLAPRSGGAIT